MSWFSRRDNHGTLSKEIKAVKAQADNTAQELAVVKKRQTDIERRVNFLNQELEVQQRKIR